MRSKLFVGLTWLLGLATIVSPSDSDAAPGNLLPNPGFDRGVDAPEGWRLADGNGEWEKARVDVPALVRIRGTGEDAGSWQCRPEALRGGELYRMSFWGRRVTGATGGTAVSGPGRVNRDFPLSDDWRQETFVFANPVDGSGDVVRLGQWHVRGALEFRSARLVPVRAAHHSPAEGVVLGEGESVRAGVYRFEPDFGWEGSNVHRPLATNRAAFNSNRWLFGRGSEIVYQLGVAGRPQRDGRLRLGINHHVGGTLSVEASREGTSWTRLGSLDGEHRTATWDLPSTWFPAGTIWIRLGQFDAGGGLQVDNFAYEARLVDARGLDADGETWFVEEGQTAETAARRGPLEASDYGEPLTDDEAMTVWWCDSLHKVGRRRPPPAARAGKLEDRPVRVQLARGEYEPVQVVLRPKRDLVLEAASVGVFRDDRGREVTLEASIDEVAYVRVVRPTDPTCVRGWYPDPLPPLRGSLRLRAGENQPLWITLHAGRDAARGEARGTLELRSDAGRVVIPLAVEVFDFEMPRETHLRSALGLGMGEIARYHRLTRPEDRVAVYEKYLADFAEHRISPYAFYDHAPIGVSFAGEGTNRTARVDFGAFDRAAERWLGPGGFNTFQLPLRGMGGGTFHSRHLGRLDGFEEGTPEHARLFGDYLGQVERHLRERGWLSRAFTYWFDEPDPKDYEFVVAGMKRLKAAAPGIRRMLTEQPEPALMGHVDIWCGLTPEWTREAVRARREAGEEVWWYICTAPKAPYVTEFIDHPGTELRLWPWQSWQYGVTGILVWATIYWTSPLAYPEPALQDPWSDPMSWVTGYGYPVGHRAPWGNGDGRFLYPPRRDPNQASEPCLDGPIHSLRWENLRDGMEDYEYLWRLEREIERAAAEGANPIRLAEARGLLTIPDSVSRDLTRFTTNPRPIREHRTRVARMIEQLRTSP